MKKLNALLVFLISSIAITGISFIDGKIWDVVFIVIGLIAYSIVGFLFSIGVLSTRQNGKDAYMLVFFLLILGGFGVYKLLEMARNWILSWPLLVKIMVPSFIFAGTCIVFFFVVRKMVEEGKENKVKEEIKYGKNA